MRLSFARLLSVLLLGLLTAPLVGCSGERSRLETIAKSAAKSRPATAIALRKAFYAGEITANGAIDLAYERVDRAPGSKIPTSTPVTTNDIAFAGAVLDFADQAEPDIEKKVQNEFFWVRLGTLAGTAALAAQTLNDLPAARSVVLAGPKRWQNEAYWRQHPDHDALASMILFESDEGDAALKRLQDRPDLDDQLVQVKTKIETEMKKRPRK
jgi:hypothetical protein